MPKRSSIRPTKNESAKTAISSETERLKPIFERAIEKARGVGEPGKNPAAQALGRLGGLKGGKARAESMTTEQRKEIAKKAAEARWGKKD